MRTPTLLLCLGLGLSLTGCAGANAAHEMPGAEPEPMAAITPAAPATRLAAKKDEKKSGKKDEAKEEWWKEGGITREKINAMCWMKFEQGRRDVSIDKRADLVNDCVQQTLKEHPLQ